MTRRVCAGRGCARYEGHSAPPSPTGKVGAKPWFLVIKLPLTRRSQFYLKAATGRWFYPQNLPGEFVTPWFCVGVHKVAPGLPSVSLGRIGNRHRVRGVKQ